MNDDEQLIRDLESEIRLLVQEKGNSLEVMKLAGAFFAVVPDVQSKSVQTPEKDHKSSDTIYNHKPKDVADFMRLFNTSGGLKYLTHDFDEADKSFDIEHFLLQAKRTFDESVGRKGVSKGRLQIPQSLWSIVNQFAFEEKPAWGLNRNYHDGWTTVEWINWSKKNERHPIRNPRFEKVIESFRRLTRVEAPQLQSLIEGTLSTILQDQKDHFTINLIDCDKGDFYTNVDYFKLALELIWGSFKRRNSFTNISVRYLRKSQGDYKLRILRICQHNSIPSKPLSDVIEELSNQKGDFWGIRNNLYGYCDWQIETVWEEKPVRINILKAQEKNDHQINTESILEITKEYIEQLEIYGFCHVLTFYYR